MDKKKDMIEMNILEGAVLKAITCNNRLILHAIQSDFKANYYIYIPTSLLEDALENLAKDKFIKFLGAKFEDFQLLKHFDLKDIKIDAKSLLHEIHSRKPCLEFHEFAAITSGVDY